MPAAPLRRLLHRMQYPSLAGKCTQERGDYLQEAFYEYFSWKQLLLRYSFILLSALMLLSLSHRPFRRRDRSHWPDRGDRSTRPARSSRRPGTSGPARDSGPDRCDWSDRRNRPERSDRRNWRNRPHWSYWTHRGDWSDRPDRCNRSHWSYWTHRPDRPDRSGGNHYSRSSSGECQP